MENDTVHETEESIAETYTRASSCLEILFDSLNEKYFDSELEKPVITIQSTPKAYGHFTIKDTWHVWDGGKDTKKKEINIGAGTIDRSIYEVAATMIHEMVHFYNHIHGIKDVCNNGIYHNKKFKEQAEKRGLIIDKHDKYGWTITYPSKELCAWLYENDFTDIKMGRIENWAEEGADGKNGNDNNNGIKKKKSSTRKYKCSSCGISVRATKEVRIMCIDCNMKMERA